MAASVSVNRPSTSLSPASFTVKRTSPWASLRCAFPKLHSFFSFVHARMRHLSSNKSVLWRNSLEWGEVDRGRGGRGGLYARLEKAPEGFLQLFAVAAAQRELGAVSEADLIVAVKKRREFGDAIQIHDRRAMNAEELSRVEALFNRSHCAAQQMRLAAHVQADIIIGSFDPIDFLDAQKQNPATGANHEALGPWATFLKILQQ